MAESAAREFIKQRDDPDVSWTVFREGDVILKEFRIHQLRSFLNRRWRREHRALKRLNQHGIRSPRTDGFESPELKRVLYRREFVAGENVHGLNRDQIADVGGHFAEVHGAGVTNGDASFENLVRLPEDGGYMLIDYGRSHIYHLRSPWFYFNVGKELARVRRQLVKGDADKWRRFMAGYLERAVYPGWGLALTQWSMSHWLRVWEVPFDRTELRLEST